MPVSRQRPPRSIGRKSRWLLVSSGAAALVLAPTIAATAATQVVAHPAATTGMPVAGVHPQWATAKSNQGPVSASTPMSVRVYLAGRDPAGLASFATSVATPGSKDYRHFLTPAQVLQRFGPSSAQVSAVRSWVTSAGLKVVKVNRHYVAVAGTASQAEQAFGVKINNFEAEGGVRYAPTGAVTVPASVSSAVLGVVGLDNGKPAARPTLDFPPPPDTTIRAAPCSQFWDASQATSLPFTFDHTAIWTECGMTPQQLQSVYGVPSTGLTGAGQTVAVVDAYASPTMASDMTSYTRTHATADFKPGQFTQTLPSDFTNETPCGGPFWRLEESLDVEAVHNMAPAASIDYVGAASCSDEDLTDALANIVDNHLASIVSNSWTLGDDDSNTQAQNDAAEQVFEQAAAEGIGMYFSSGDCGASDPATGCDGSDTPQTYFPPSSPMVTAVGGTTLAINSSGQEQFQTGWGDLTSSLSSDGKSWTPAPGTGYPNNFDGGSGGGTTDLFSQPSYQQGVVPASLADTLTSGTAASGPMRVEPDISADADNNTGMLVGFTQTDLNGSATFHETRFGGTSLATPVFAALQALAQQAQGAPIGFANPRLYAKYKTSAIEDVTDSPFGSKVLTGVARNDFSNPQDPSSSVMTRVFTFGHDGLLHATTGYDDETGLGAPSATGYLKSYGG